MNEREQLEQAIANLEAQKDGLDDTVVDAALLALRRKLSLLIAEEKEGNKETSVSLRGGELKVVTVMFADISGFTALSEKLDPESVRNLMNDCFERLVPIIGKYQGNVDKFIGDEIMALFGAPVTHEKDPERALLAALEMIEALERFNVERGLGLGMHFGINTGRVVAGLVGSVSRQEYSVMGDAVNLAARLKEAAKRGQILVGPDTHRVTSHLFRFENFEPIRLKGKSEPVRPYRLLTLRFRQEDRPRSGEDPSVGAPLVGRDEELASLQQCVDNLLEGKGGIVAIVGEAGLGKTRLVEELRGYPAGGSPKPALLWLEGRTLSFVRTIGYRPFQEMIRRYAGITEEKGESGTWERLERTVSALFPGETAEILPYLASLISMEVKDPYRERVRYLDGEGMKHRVFLACRRFFARVAEMQPLILLFEDLHWVDESSALLLEHLLPLAATSRLLIVGTARPERGTPATRLREVALNDYASSFLEVRLAPLPPSESARMVEHLLGNKRIPSPVQEMLLQRGEGNPFFLEEIVNVLVRTPHRMPDRTDAQSTDTVELQAFVIPHSIQGVVMARVDRLSEKVRDILKTASVIGRSFFYQVLAAVVRADRDLDRHLADLESVELIHRNSRSADMEYLFKHALAQQVTYESILMQTRRELHASVGRALENLYAHRLEEMYSLLAKHFAQAEQWDKARDYLLKAGDQSLLVAADAEALAHYEQAMDAYTRGSGSDRDPLQRASLERKMGEVLFRRGDHTRAAEHLHRSLYELGSPLPASRRGVKSAIVGELGKQMLRRLLPKFMFKKPLGPVSPEVEEELRIYEVLGWIDAFSDYEHLFLVALRALNVSEKNGYEYGISKGFTALGTICDLGPFFRLARLYHSRSVAIAEEIRHPAALGLARTGMAFHEICRADWNAAIHQGRAAGEAHNITGDLHGWGYASYMAAVALVYRGDLQEAIALCDDIVRLGREGADRQVDSWGLATRGFALRIAGRIDEAVPSLQEALATANAIDDHVVRIWSLAEMARCLVSRDESDEALKAIEESRRIYEERKNLRFIWVTFHGAEAEVFLHLAAKDEGPSRSDWLKKARRACSEALKQGKAYAAAMPDARQLQSTFRLLRS